MVNVAVGSASIGSWMDRLKSFCSTVLGLLGVRTAFDFVHMSSIADGAMTGRVRDRTRCSTVHDLGTSDDRLFYLFRPKS